MHSKLFSEYKRHRFEHGGEPPHPSNNTSITEEEVPQMFEGDWSSHHASNWKGAFPKMSNTDKERYPNLNLSKAGFMSLAMSKHYGYEDDIKMTSGERLGYDQWRVMKEYQYPQDMSLYNRDFQKVVKDSITTFGMTERADLKIEDWIEAQYAKYENGEITEKQLRKKVSSHIVGSAGDFTGDFRSWLRSGKSEDFRTAFNINALDEGDHFHVPFMDINSETLGTEAQAHYGHYSDMFDRMAKENNRGQLRISMNPTDHNLEDLSGMYMPELPMIQPSLLPQNELDLPSTLPVESLPMPDLPEKKKGFLSNFIEKQQQRRFENGGSAGWRKRSMAEYGKANGEPQDIHKKELQANVSAIQPTNLEGNNFTLNTDVLYDPPIIQDDIKSFSVNKDGWADVEVYRSKKDDAQFIMNTQNQLIQDGFTEVVNDGLWGNQTYNTINKDLVNQQLDNYGYSNFSKTQFLDQVYKESHGDNSKVSPAGAMGISQFMPATFGWMKEKGWIPETAKITDVAAQSLAQRRYMDYLYEDRKNIKSAPNSIERQARSFAAYNQGPAAFDKFWGGLTAEEKKGGWKTWYKKSNPETQKYVLWMMDKASYKKQYDIPEKRGKIITSKWNDVYYGYESWIKKEPTYRY